MLLLIFMGVEMVVFENSVLKMYLLNRLCLGLIWGSRDDTRSDMEKVMY